MNAARKITSIFLAVIFLLSGIGFTIGKMVCLKSGKTFISLSAAEDCCSKKKNKEQQPLTAEINKGGCCDISNTTFKLKDFHSSKINKAEAISFTLLANKEIYAAVVKTGSVSNDQLFFADLPPPLYGKALLNHISILII